LCNTLDAYKKLNDDKDFVFMHCFKKLEGYKKWDQVRLTLREVSDGEGPTTPIAASADMPQANVKKAKAAKQASSSTSSGIDASITKMIELITENSDDSNERSDVRWKAMYETQQEKLKLKRERVAAAKLEAKPP
jgi:hypothetical protein